MSKVIKRQYNVTKKGVCYTVELRIDIDAIAHDMVNGAARSAAGKATRVGGSIVANVISRTAPHHSAESAGGGA